MQLRALRGHPTDRVSAKSVFAIAVSEVKPTTNCLDDTVLMTFRSDRRGDEPTTSLALEAMHCDRLPVRDFHHGPETSDVSLDEAEDTNAVRSHHRTCCPALAEGVQMR